MPGHGHSHGHGGCDHGAAGKVGEEAGLAYSLYQKIDMFNLECLNETIEGSGKDVFKPWENRLDREKFVESDADEELLFNIPFTGEGATLTFKIWLGQNKVRTDSTKSKIGEGSLLSNCVTKR